MSKAVDSTSTLTSLQRCSLSTCSRPIEKGTAILSKVSPGEVLPHCSWRCHSIHQQSDYIDRDDLYCTKCSSEVEWDKATNWLMGSADSPILYFCKSGSCKAEFMLAMSKRFDTRVEPPIESNEAKSKAELKGLAEHKDEPAKSTSSVHTCFGYSCSNKIERGNAIWSMAAGIVIRPYCSWRCVAMNQKGMILKGFKSYCIECNEALVAGQTETLMLPGPDVLQLHFCAKSACKSEFEKTMKREAEKKQVQSSTDVVKPASLIRSCIRTGCPRTITKENELTLGERVIRQCSWNCLRECQQESWRTKGMANCVMCLRTLVHDNHTLVTWGKNNPYLMFCTKGKCHQDFKRLLAESEGDEDDDESDSDSESDSDDSDVECISQSDPPANLPPDLECSYGECEVKVDPDDAIKIGGLFFCTEECVRKYQIDSRRMRLDIVCRNCGSINARFDTKWVVPKIGDMAFCKQGCYDAHVMSTNLINNFNVSCKRKRDEKEDDVFSLKHKLVRTNAELSDLKRKYEDEKKMSVKFKAEIFKYQEQVKYQSDWQEKYEKLVARINKTAKELTDSVYQ